MVEPWAVWMLGIAVSLRVTNTIKRALRCHDFRSDQGVRRSQYREYWQGARRGDGRKVVPALRVAARIGAYCVGPLDRIRDTLCVGLLVITNSGCNARVFYRVCDSLGVCFARNCRTRGFAASSAAPVFQSGMYSTLGISFAISSDTGRGCASSLPARRRHGVRQLATNARSTL